MLTIVNLWPKPRHPILARIAWALFALGLSFGGSSHAQVAVPPLKARVTDLTGTLNDEQQRALEAKLAAFEQRRGSQIAVLLVPTTQPETIEEYSMRVVQQWRLGRNGVDDGALLLVAKDDRALRIEVGYGLEGTLPDVTARRIVDEAIVPRFRSGDFAGGVDTGVDLMVRQIEGERLPEPVWHPTPPATSRWDRFGTLVFWGIALLLVAHDSLREMLGRLPAAAIVSCLAGISIWWIGQTLAGALFIALPLFVLALLSRKSTTPSRNGRGPFGLGRGGWGGLGGGFGGGGFGGGGGGFGGGGFSGHW